ncbi:Protein of unknown function [Micromonospora lupini str. Lupac 08]|uniref:Uncharacterized protein n=1 Tax=Micromonospora lupini str. Lupac 08 TaxID=1150864 RepID=I0L571_9ACTN|nr:Protein of unknown function [Micromonospora lupini str. Lupac 08]
MDRETPAARATSSRVAGRCAAAVIVPSPGAHPGRAYACQESSPDLRVVGKGWYPLVVVALSGVRSCQEITPRKRNHSCERPHQPGRRPGHHSSGTDRPARP